MSYTNHRGLPALKVHFQQIYVPTISITVPFASNSSDNFWFLSSQRPLESSRNFYWDTRKPSSNLFHRCWQPSNLGCSDNNTRCSIDYNMLYNITMPSTASVLEYATTSVWWRIDLANPLEDPDWLPLWNRLDLPSPQLIYREGLSDVECAQHHCSASR